MDPGVLRKSYGHPPLDRVPTGPSAISELQVARMDPGVLCKGYGHPPLDRVPTGPSAISELQVARREITDDGDKFGIEGSIKSMPRLARSRPSDRAARRKALEARLRVAQEKAASEASLPLMHGRISLIGLVFLEILRAVVWIQGTIPGYSVFGMHFLTTTSDVACILCAVPLFAVGTQGQCVMLGCLGPMLTLVFAMSLVDICALGAYLVVATPRPLNPGAKSYMDALEASIGVWEFALVASVGFQVSLCASSWRVYRELRTTGLYPPGSDPASVGKLREISVMEVMCEAEDVELLTDCEFSCDGGVKHPLLGPSRGDDVEMVSAASRPDDEGYAEDVRASYSPVDNGATRSSENSPASSDADLRLGVASLSIPMGQQATGRGKKSLPSTPVKKFRPLTPRLLENVCLDEEVRARSPVQKNLIMDAVRDNAQIMDVLQLTEDQIQMIAQEVVLQVLPSDALLYDSTKEEGWDALYIVQEGLLEVLEHGKAVTKYRSGQSFGETGLLYGVPCRQDVRAAMKSRVWKLTQESFRHVLRAKPASRLREYAEMCSATSIFNSVGEPYLEVLAKALEEQFFVRGEDVVLVGQQIEMLYIVFDGTIMIGEEHRGGRHLHKANYFGLQQMSHRVCQHRRVHVVSDTATLLTLDRNLLELLTGMTVPELAAVQCEASDDEAQGSRSPSKSSTPARGASKSRSLQAPIPKDRLSRIGVLGAGSFGLVTLEEDTATGQWYALKAVSKGYCVQQGLQEMPLREKSLQLMLDSPFIIKLVSTYKDDQFLYFLLQPAVGGELFELYNRHEEWFGQKKYALFFLAGAALGLEHMHSRKIVYRDMKLENILMDSNGYTLIADMGLAKVVPGKTHTLCGTADYMAPEQLRRQGYNHAVDWWALGVMLFMMMSGGSPFEASEVAQIYRNIVKGFKKDMYPKSFDKELVDVIGGLCKKKPEERVPMGSRGLEHLKEMDWFEAFSWARFADRHMPPPWVPPVKTIEDYARDALGITTPPVVSYSDDGTGWDKEF